MISLIGPFWDANETRLVLGVGLVLVAFPIARGVAFDFRVKVKAEHKHRWDTAFFAGSLLAAFAQGVMLGQLITGFSNTPVALMFSDFIDVGLTAGYALLGASWLVMKTKGELQLRAVRWARISAWGTGAGIAAVSIATPMVSPAIFE